MTQTATPAPTDTRTDLQRAHDVAELYKVAVHIGDTEERIAGFLATYEEIIERLGYDPLI